MARCRATDRWPGPTGRDNPAPDRKGAIVHKRVIHIACLHMGLAGQLGGRMRAGIMALTAVGGSNQGPMATTGVFCATPGLWWGYKAFFQEVAFVLDE